MSESLKKTSIYFFLPYLSLILILKYIGIDKVFIKDSILNFLHFIIPSCLVLLSLFMLSRKDNACLKNAIYAGGLIAISILAIWYIVLHNIFFQLFDNFSFLLWAWSYLIPFVFYYRNCHKFMNEKTLSLYEKTIRGTWAFFLIIPPLVYVVYAKYETSHF
ncbi:MAG: hypothetical protein BV457_08500 [Thermoplasmata archaeon M9B1D]|nr:MAG: hypothetical protein BV457_08500 [Thermoplasmata archaeon M9B1D]PNX46446.1 MAG: hypothetical protein BV456_12215 [Thermoplasmata archaeon M8B2D]